MRKEVEMQEKTLTKVVEKYRYIHMKIERILRKFRKFKLYNICYNFNKSML
jgi:D-mannonate dehydratase